MRRGLIPAALSIAAVSAVALTVPGVGYAAPAAHGRAAKTVTVRKADPVGDEVVRSGKVSDMSSSPSSLAPFKPGHGTVVPATAADREADLTRVTYRVRRTGPQPALLITYVVAAPFTFSSKTSHTDSTYSQTTSDDVVETLLGKGYTVGAADDSPRDYGLLNKRGKRVTCKGLRTSMKVTMRVATQTVPLSCLNDHGLRTARMRSAAVHLDADVTASVGNPVLRMAPTMAGRRDTTAIVVGDVTAATDYSAKTRRLQLTPLGE